MIVLVVGILDGDRLLRGVNLDQIYRARNAGLCDLPQTRFSGKTRSSGGHIFMILELWNCLGSGNQLIILVGDRAL